MRNDVQLFKFMTIPKRNTHLHHIVANHIQSAATRVIQQPWLKFLSIHRTYDFFPV